MSKGISDKYVKLTQREHVLMRPDTYIGSVNKDIKQKIKNATNINQLYYDLKIRALLFLYIFLF